MTIDASPEGLAVFAGEYALGLLDGDERARARLLERDDPGFAALVDDWTRRFEPMFAQWPSCSPPVELERRVLAVTGARVANDNVVARWKWATVAFASIAAALGVALVLRSPVPPSATSVRQPPELVVAFAVDDGAKALPAIMDLTRRELRLPDGLVVPHGKTAQLWLIEGERPPHPIGLFRPTANGLAATLELDRDIPKGAVLAISIEPPGGSPTGLPTGPVVAKGTAAPI